MRTMEILPGKKFGHITTSKFFYRKKKSRTEAMFLGTKNLQSKKQKVINGMVKKPAIRAIRKYRIIRSLVGAAIIGLLSNLKGRSCPGPQKWTFSQRLFVFRRLL